MLKNQDLDELIDLCSWENNKYFEKVNSVRQETTSIFPKNLRSCVRQENSRGTKLKRLEESIANLNAT